MAISASKRLEVYKRDTYRCVNCGSRNRLTVDHIKPVSEGGDDELDNLQTMCHWCNQQKGNYVEKWWHRFIPFVNWKTLNRFKNEVTSSMISKDMDLEKRIEKRIADIQPKVTQSIKDQVKLLENNVTLKVTGMKNTVEAYNKRSKERDKRLLYYLELLAERVEELENNQ